MQNLGCTKPITPGVLPFSSKKELEIMSKKCGVELPKDLIEDINGYKDERDVKKFGEMYITSLVQELLDNGVPGIHFYTQINWNRRKKYYQPFKLINNDKKETAS